MDKIGKLSFTTAAYLRDFKGDIPLTTLGNYLLHAATQHAESRGFGYEDMVDKQTAWVLSKMAIELFEPLNQPEPLQILTWIESVQRFTTTRCFEITDSQGKQLGYARSIWAAINMETRRPVLLDDEKLAPYLHNRPCPIENPQKIMAAETDSTPHTQIHVLYSDLDINRHLNSIKYIEHTLDLFPLEVLENKHISRFEIAYHSEGRYGMELEVYLKQIDDKKQVVSFINENKAICRCAIHWK